MKTPREFAMYSVTRARNPLFFTAITINAVFSILCGLVMAATPNTVAVWLGITRTADIVAVGVFLLGFAGLLLWIRWRGRIFVPMAWGIVIGDLGWVAYSAVLVGGFSQHFTGLGLWLIADVALLVGLFAGLQARGLLKPRGELQLS
jgi:hypothetical protein